MASTRPSLLFYGEVTGEGVDEKMAMLRFESSRITQIRLVPAGVKAFSHADLAHHIGRTSPHKLELDVYFHILPPPRTPATVQPMRIEYDAATGPKRLHAYEPKLAADVRGRLLVITGRFDVLTLAIYGFVSPTPAPAREVTPPASSVDQPPLPVLAAPQDPPPATLEVPVAGPSSLSPSTPLRRSPSGPRLPNIVELVERSAKRRKLNSGIKLDASLDAVADLFERRTDIGRAASGLFVAENAAVTPAPSIDACENALVAAFDSVRASPFVS